MSVSNSNRKNFDIRSNILDFQNFSTYEAWILHWPQEIFKSEMSLSSRWNIIDIRCDPGHTRMYKLKMTASKPDQEVSPRHINRWWSVIINSVSELSWLMDEGNDYWKISYDRKYRLFWPIFDFENSTLILNHHINEDNHHVRWIFSRYRMSSMPNKTHS